MELRGILDLGLGSCWYNVGSCVNIKIVFKDISLERVIKGVKIKTKD